MQLIENKSDNLTTENDEDSLYNRSLIPIFQQLPSQKKRLAKMKVSELLCKTEFQSDEFFQPAKQYFTENNTLEGEKTTMHVPVPRFFSRHTA